MARSQVGLEAGVNRLRIVLIQPRIEFGQLLRSQRSDSVFDLLNRVKFIWLLSPYGPDMIVASIGAHSEHELIAIRIAVMDVSAGLSPSLYGRFVVNGAHLKPATP